MSLIPYTRVVALIEIMFRGWESAYFSEIDRIAIDKSPNRCKM